MSKGAAVSMRAIAISGLVPALCALGPGCASQECDFNSQCGERFYCELGRCLQECRVDLDCESWQACSAVGRCIARPDGWVSLDDTGVDAMDSGVDPLDSAPAPDTGVGPVDTGVGPVDTGVGPVDTGIGPVDTGPPPGTGAYLDRCATGADCESGLCAPDTGGSRFCTRTCGAHGDCADEHVCAGGACARDDTGATCDTAAPETCALGLCLGLAGGPAHCTRDCSTARDCPAGYACHDAGGGNFVCADIEQPAGSCVTGLSLGSLGCTSYCRGASDCPARLNAPSVGLTLPPYVCGLPTGGSRNVCLVPADVAGSGPIGTPCVDYTPCRSGLCNTDALPTAMCTQACDPEGGCGPQLGCWPEAESGDFITVCARAGSRALTQSCATGRECDSGLCDATSGRCTRYCADGLCPTGWRCEGTPGFPSVPPICRM